MSPRILTCRKLEEDPAALVRRHLADPRHAWSVGTYGALAEFDYEADEPGLKISADGLTVCTRRGSLAVHGLAHASAYALDDETGRLRQIAFCSQQLGARRDRVTALDPRTFDVGIGAPHIDMLVRLAEGDEETAAALAQSVGKPLLAPGTPAGPAIGRASPTRILQSAIARLEVHQPIPPAGGRSPEGPHTHLLPKFLAKGLAHAPGTTLPDGLYCGLSLYPRP